MWYQVENSGNPDYAAYRDNILFHQTATRYVNAWHHHKPWHYFITQVIPAMWFPLPLLLLVGWRQVAALWRQDVRIRILLSWALLVLLFFSFSSGKRGVYIYPALPVMAIVCAVLWSNMRLTSRRWLSLGITALLLILLSAVLAVGVAGWLQLLPQKAKFAAYQPLIAELAPWLVLMAALSFALLFILRRGPLFWRLAIVVLANWLLVSAVFWPKLDPYRTPQAIMAKVELLLAPEAELGLVEFKEQFLVFAHRPVTQFSYLLPTEEQVKSAWQWQQQNANRYILLSTEATSAASCFDLDKAIDLGFAHREHWLLLSSSAALAHCDAPADFKMYQFQPPK